MPEPVESNSVVVDGGGGPKPVFRHAKRKEQFQYDILYDDSRFGLFERKRRRGRTYFLEDCIANRSEMTEQRLRNSVLFRRLDREDIRIPTRPRNDGLDWIG